MITITKLDTYGKPIMGECPEHGEVEIISMPSEGTGSLKRINRAKAAGGKVNYGNGPKKGQLSCGCTFTSNEVNNELSKQFNYVCRLIELANDISFENRHDITTNDDHVDFSNRMFELFKDNIHNNVLGTKITLTGDFTGEEYNKIINEFEGIEKFIHNGTNYKINKKGNIIDEYYFIPEKQITPDSYTWDDFFTIKNDGSKEAADYLIKWCEHNNVSVELNGNESFQEIADKCVSAMYGDVEL